MQESAAQTAREKVQSALVAMGFRKTETERALGAMDPNAWSQPIATLVRDALGVLT